MGMDKKKGFLIELGPRTEDTGTTEALLKQTLAESQRKKVERQDELDEAKHEAAVAKARKEAANADAAASNPGTAKPTESPVKFEVKGGVNLGTIDFDAERKQATEKLEKLKKEQDENLRAVGQENERLREEIHKGQIDLITINLNAQMEVLRKMIESGASKGDFTQQLTAARAIAAELGYAPASAGGSSGGDIMVQIKLKEIEFNNTIALRKLDEETKDRDMQRKIDLQRLEDERGFKKQEAERLAKRDEFFASFPELIGRGFARGLTGTNVEGTGGESQPEKHISSQVRQPQPGIIAGVGESGEAACTTPGCGAPIAIAPTSNKAICAQCGTVYPIVRVQKEPSQPPPEQAVNTEHPEDT